MRAPDLAWPLTCLRHQIRCEASAQKLLRLLREMIERAEEAKYRPDQPRAPRGTPIGGQWINDPTSARQQTLRDGRVLVAQSWDDAFYDIDIRLEDAKGGHGWRKHVERSRAQLRAVMDAEGYIIRLPDGGSELHYHEAEGTFWSTGDANVYVSETLKANPELVELAARGTMGKAPIKVTKRYDTPIGYEAFRTSYDAPELFRHAFWVEVWIVHDPNGSRGYRVDTAYPMNEIADEEPIL